MTENLSCPQENVVLDQEFSTVTQNCPGCLINCYMMEESIGFTGKTFKERLLNLAFLILEIPTLIQIAKVVANREKSDWGTFKETP